MPNPLPPALLALEERLGLASGALLAEDRTRALRALDDAATLALAEVSAIRATAWALDAPKVVVLVVLKAARREYENPEGYSTESLGEHAVGLSETSGVYLTAREIAQIRRAATKRAHSFVGTVRLTSPYGEQ